MSELYRDPQIEALIQELNLRTAADPEAPFERVEVGSGLGSEGEGELAPSDVPRRQAVDEESGLARLLSLVDERGASDLLVVAGVPPYLRVNGRLVLASVEALDSEAIRGLFLPYLDARLRRTLQEQGAADFSLGLGTPSGAPRRFRVNLHRQRGQASAAVRALPSEIPTLRQLNLPEALGELVGVARGLVLLCGPTGSGKTSTLAALIGEINRTRSCHLLTIEDPIEFEHPNARALVEQVEVGTDAPSFAAALKSALRQDPDVILVGEMRDLETIATALTAAETGHLVLSTLHTHDAAQAIHRIVDVFPAAQQGQIRQQLALALHAIVCQQLVPRADGRGRLPAVEVLLATPAVRHLIRQEQMQKLAHEITLGKRHGMISLEESLARLVRAGAIAVEEARMRSARLEELESLLRG
jgi:twitching motility protein PilT